jgi:hypothetical protein
MRSFGRFVSANWRGFLARLPLPLLALAASYGVYRFATLFVPQWVAITQACAFEATYLGLAVVQGLDVPARRRAAYIGMGAVAVSIIYNSLDGLFHRRPELLVDMPLWAEVGLAVLHGAPLALVSYLVANLLLHDSKSNNAVQSDKLAVGGRPAEYSVEDMISAFTGETVIKRAEVVERLGCSPATASKLLADAVDVGSVKKNGVGYILQK